MFPEWHHAVPESAYFKVPETLKTFRMYPISRFVYVLHWLATRLVGWHRGHTWKSSTYEMFWAFLVLWSMLIQELHDATRETLSNVSDYPSSCCVVCLNMLVSNMTIIAYPMPKRYLPFQYMGYTTWPQLLMLKNVFDDLKSPWR